MLTRPALTRPTLNRPNLNRPALNRLFAVTLLLGAGAAHGLTLSGTLEAPGTPGPWPLAIIVAGSGPTDRDGNSAGLPGPNDSLKQLAQALARQGVATLRYDKRGVGKSVGDAPLREEDVTLNDFVADALSWVRKYKSDPRFTKVALIGHSEGALISLLAAAQEEVGAVVSLAGPGENLADTLTRQLSANPAALEASAPILAELRAGRRVAQIPAGLEALFRHSVQPFLISLFRAEPAQAIRAFTAPVLIVQGDRDLQVAVQDAQKLKTARPSAELLIVPGMNHVLKAVGDDLALNQRAYVDASVPLAPALVPALAQFLKASLR